ncbi:MAG: prepilin-type N-terminal cleavage/methylation domain-containing protein [Alphaproteobacteria bacterium]|nr:prepilin-type N-terminal cleavage/methylation domain-containing protein [Alphaproteobacteria bacterium]
MRSGFTLLETLIALVIAALITLVLMDTLSAATGHASRIEAATRAHTARTLALIPVMRALDAAVPDYHDAENVFTGDAVRASGLTVAGVAGTESRPAAFALEIAREAGADEARLIYHEAGEALISVAVPAEARLAYRDDDGVTHEVWPPEDGFDPDPLYYRPIPSAILILDGERAVLAAAPARTSGLTLRVRDFDLVL